MSALLRGARLLAHVALSAVGTLRFALTRRGAVLVFRHEPDRDATGTDVQMGALVAELEGRDVPFLEVVFVPLSRSALRRERARSGRPFVSHAALLAAARVLGEGAVRAFLALVRPRFAILIDESGSGQLLVRAARRRGVPTIGVQHGDFQPDNAQYARPGPEVEPVDRLALWSPWFAERLLAISPLYEPDRLAIVGRLAHGRSPALDPPARTGATTVLLLGERGKDFRERVAPFLEAVRADAALRLVVRPHPAEPAEAWPRAERSRHGLVEDLRHAAVVVGESSSALLEAAWWGRPAIVLETPGRRDPAGLVAAGAAVACARPEELSGLVRELLSVSKAERERVRQLVWGGVPDPGRSPAARVLALGTDLGVNHSGVGCRFVRSGRPRTH